MGSSSSETDKLTSILKWLVLNKQWLFSGIGVAAFTVLIALLGESLFKELALHKLQAG